MGTTDTITDADAAGMLRHWLSTPRFSRLGQDYGNRISEWLQQPLHADAASHANAAVRDLRSDIALFEYLQVDVFVDVVRPDKRFVVFDVSGRFSVVSDGTSATIGAAG